MARTFISPGVFTSEFDASFLPAAVADIAAVIIGPTEKGPAFVPTVAKYDDYLKIFGKQDEKYLASFTNRFYSKYKTPSVLRVMPLSGSTTQKKIYTLATGSGPTNVATIMDKEQTAITPTVTTTSPSESSFIFNYGTQSVSMSFDTGSEYYIEKAMKAFLELELIQWAKSGSVTDLDRVADAITVVDYDIGSRYAKAYTPWLVSQDIGGQTYDLFRFGAISDGNSGNESLKISIQDITVAGKFAGNDYPSFNVVVRKFGDTDTKMEILESFRVSMNPAASDYFAKVIDNDYEAYNETHETILGNGDYPLKSKYVFVEESTLIKNSDVPESAYPWGHAALTGSFVDDTEIALYELNFSTGSYQGIDFGDPNNLVAFGEFIDAATITFPNSSLTVVGSASASKFTVPFQGGFDGGDRFADVLTGTDVTAANCYGFDLSNSTAAGTLAYRRAADIIADQDLFDFDIVVTPGVFHNLGPSVTDYFITKVEERADMFYIIDPTKAGSTVGTAEDACDTIDSSYAATYWPHVKILNTDTNKPLTVPPSVVMLGAYAFNDTVAAEWFAPAGMQRGALSNAIKAELKLSTTHRDTLYKSRVNPIATFPGTVNVVAWGQKTLQALPSKLDRVKARRLLISLKKFVSSSSKFLVFENIDQKTYDRFVNLVTPFLETIQQQGGIEDFQVIMDESNNTAADRDRDILVGTIKVIPTGTAEFVDIGFEVFSSGATFDA